MQFFAGKMRKNEKIFIFLAEKWGFWGRNANEKMKILRCFFDTGSYLFLDEKF